MSNQIKVVARYKLIPCVDGSYDLYDGMQFSRLVANVENLEQAKIFVENRNRPELFLDDRGNVIDFR